MRTLIYASLFGKLRLCRPLIPQDRVNADCILFTDRDPQDLQVGEGWKIVKLVPWANTMTMVKILKCLPHYLGDYDRSICIDAHLRCRRPLLPVFDAMGDADIACFKHPKRKTAAEEWRHVRRHKMDDPRRLDRTAAAIELENFGLYLGGMMWRKHTPATLDFGLKWMMKMFMGTKRDQISMHWAIQASGIKLHEIHERRVGQYVMIHVKR